MWIVCITSVRHVLTVNGYGGRQTKENEKSWCFKGWETLVNKQRINIRKDTSYVIVSCLEMTILYPRMSRNRLQTRKTDAKRRCALHPEKSNKDLLNKAFYHVFLISIAIIIITIIKSRIGIYLIFRNREQ